MRVIAGEAKGTILKTPPGRSTRPMSGRSRGALFNILAARLPGAQVLDLYAGSGSLGIEALSRGASGCVFVEKNRACARLLEENLARSRLAGGEVLAAPCVLALKTLAARGAGFTLAFFDPPFALGKSEENRATLGREMEALGRLLRPGALAVYRLERRNHHPGNFPASLTPFDRREYGRSLLLFMERCADRPPETVESAP